MRLPWQKRHDAAIAETEQAKNEYEWAVQNRSTVSALVNRLVYHGQQNAVIERLNMVARGGRRNG